MTLHRRRDNVRERMLRLFSISPEAMREYRSVAGEYLKAFLSRPEVTTACEPISLPQAPDNGKEIPFSTYLDYVLNKVISQSTNMASPRCLGHMTGATPAFLWPLSELITALNQNLVKWDASRLFTPLERQVLATMHERVYQRPQRFYEKHTQDIGSTLGIVTSGGTLSKSLLPLGGPQYKIGTFTRFCRHRIRRLGRSAGYVWLRKSGDSGVAVGALLHQ